MSAKGLSGLTWVLPTAAVALILYVAGALAAGRGLHTPIWAILLLGVPPMLLTWVALIVAFVDVSQRPKGEITEEARLVWLLVLAVLNVLAFLPYWFVVVRRHRQPAE
ncbi:MAG TPA: PLDc N-terminal domain-containing protein [Thermomicrobiaceae bacterium]|nr:PLDc N-terminal domain-containing protein [Thermomicrobiaceae bacterium]